jgi:diguanylate cyclase (GGDEF)-like protein
MRLTSSRAGDSSPRSAGSWLTPTWSTVVVIAALVLVFELDRVTGSTPVQHLYYLPIIFASVAFRMRGGLAAAVAAIALYHLANPHLFTLRYEESDLVQIVLFIAVGAFTAKLTHDAQRLHALAMTDDLTGLHNLRSFEARLATIIRRSREARTPVCLLVLDVDRLKSLNDKYGHLAGAEAVRTVGHIIAATLPPNAVACRYGGDEFVAALPGCDEAQAKGIADDLCRTVNTVAPILAGLSFPSTTLSISVGLACRSLDPVVVQSAGTDKETGEALFRAADAALYLAKEHGRNHVFVA